MAETVGIDSVGAVAQGIDGAAVGAGILAAPGARTDLEAAAVAQKAGQRGSGAVLTAAPRLPAEREMCLTACCLAAPLPPAPLLKAIDPGEERVGVPFDADGGVGPMAAVDDRGVGQGQELALDGGEERGGVAARQVGAPDGAAEEDVAAEDPAVARPGRRCRENVPARGGRRTGWLPSVSGSPGRISSVGGGAGGARNPNRAA